jgi:hypothetical protein
LLRGQQCGGTVAGIRVQVLHRATIVIHVQCVICMVVVIGILAMSDKVIQIAYLLQHRPRPKHKQRLPQKNSQATL